MKKKRQAIHGFTVMELLATITILAAIMVIAIPSFSSIYKKFSKNYYTSLEENVKMAANDYFTDNKKLIPKYVGETSHVEGNVLTNLGYLEKEVSGRTDSETCNAFARVYKTAKGKYKYHGCIECFQNGKTTYSSRDTYCNDSYNLDNNQFLVPPNNGAIAYPKEYSDYINEKNDLVILVSSQLYTKAIHDEKVEYSHTSTPIRPNAFQIIEKGELINSPITLSSTASGVDILNALETEYGSGRINKNNYELFVETLMKNKVRIKYFYENATSKVTKQDGIRRRSGETPKIVVTVKRGTQDPNGTGGAKGLVSLASLKWTNQTINVNSTNLNNSPNAKITQYLCSYEGGRNYVECDTEGNISGNGNINLTYRNQESNVKIQGKTAGGVLSNVEDYTVKVDQTAPIGNIVITSTTSGWNSKDVKLAYSSNDNASGISSVKLGTTEIFDGTNGEKDWTRDDYSYSFAENYDGGNRNVSVVVTDVAGNQGTVSNAVVYKIYQACQAANIEQYGSWSNSGSCSNACGGKQNQVRSTKDKNSSTVCPNATKKVDCGGKTEDGSPSWTSQDSTCNKNNKYKKYGTQYYKSTLDGSACGSETVSKSFDCSTSEDNVSCTVSEVNSGCTSSSNHAIKGRLHIKCDRPVKRIKVVYYYAGSSGCTTSSSPSEDLYGGSWTTGSEAKNAAWFNFRGCGESYSLRYKYIVTALNGETKTYQARDGWYDFNISSGNSTSGSCSPGAGGHWE